jgi:hypothetical protein
MSFSQSQSEPSFQWGALAILITGLLVVGAGWILPVYLKSLNPVLLKEAAKDSPSLSDFGRSLAELERIGSAQLVWEASKRVVDPGEPALAAAIADLSSRHPELIVWGGREPFLDTLVKRQNASGRVQSQPVLTLFLPEHARSGLRHYLENSRSPAVLSLLQTRHLTAYTRFIPADRPGGQPLDATATLAGLLYHGNRFSPGLSKEVKDLADGANESGHVQALEEFYLDLLTLGKRLNLLQLSDLLALSSDTKAVAQFSYVAKVAPEKFPLVYAAALMTSKSSDGVARYLERHDAKGLADLSLAAQFGQGAVMKLVETQLPINSTLSFATGELVAFCFKFPKLTLAVKYLCFLFGGFLAFCGLDRFLRDPGSPMTGRNVALPQLRTGLVAVLLAFVLVGLSEPFLLKGQANSRPAVSVSIPALSAGTEVLPNIPTRTKATMDLSTIVSIIVFALIQVLVYVTCLLKISEIDRQQVPALLKLRLMENEENLFDSGLYVGIAGTAAALVLQVLGVIEPNLLAAYSSNLFGITCVALVKIRSVRPYKRKLILAIENVGRPAEFPLPIFK